MPRDIAGENNARQLRNRHFAGIACVCGRIGECSAKEPQEMLAGPWIITSATDVNQNGEKLNTWNGPVHGQIQSGSTGRFSQLIIGPEIPAMKDKDPRKPDALIVGYYGTYTVDEATKKIRMKIEGASYSARVGQPQGFTVEGTGDTLTLIGSPRTDQSGTFTPHVEIKRP